MQLEGVEALFLPRVERIERHANMEVECILQTQVAVLLKLNLCVLYAQRPSAYERYQHV